MIKSQEELNSFVSDVEAKLTDVEQLMVTNAAASEEKIQEYKLVAENFETQIKELKEAQMIKYVMKSEDERKHNFAKFMLAIAQKDYTTIHKFGGKINVAKGINDDWKESTWTIENSATDLGTPLRGDSSTGSILIPETFASEVLRIPEDGSGMMGKVRSIPMSTRKINFPKTLAGVEYTWVTNEAAAKTEDNPTFSEVELECETAAAWVAMTEEFQEDSMVDMSQYLAELFREAWQKEFDNQVLVADTAPFVGILNNTSANVVTMGVGSTDFTDVTLDNILSLIGGLDSQTKRNGASMIMHCTILDILKGIKDDNGNPIYARAEGSQPQTLYGYPIIFSDAMPDSTSGAVSTGFVAFGNPKNLLHGNRVGMEFRIFNQTSDALVYDRNFFRVRLRQGFIAANPEGFAVLKTPSA